MRRWRQPPYGKGTEVLEIFGRPLQRGSAMHDVADVTITTGYFVTLGVRLLRGRLFTDQDRPNTEPVAIVDESLAREYFPNADPIGQRVRIRDERRPHAWASVVGVVETERRAVVYQEMSWTEPATVFRPLSQETDRSVSIAIRAAPGSTPPGASVQREIASLDADIAVGEFQLLRHDIAVFLAYPRFRAVLLGAFAALALLLAAVGLYGVLGQFIAQRRKEIGVRLALGAQPRDVGRLVAQHGAMPVFAGLAIGSACAVALGRAMAGLLYGVQPRDPFTLAAVGLTLLLTALIAISLPARRAASADPVDSLRQE